MVILRSVDQDLEQDGEDKGDQVRLKTVRACCGMHEGTGEKPRRLAVGHELTCACRSRPVGAGGLEWVLLERAWGVGVRACTFKASADPSIISFPL